MQVSIRPWLRALAAYLVVPTMVICQAPQPAQQSSQQAPQRLSRHARRIRRTLNSFPSGTTIQIQLRDHSTRFGDLGSLLPASFELLDHRTHAPTTYLYADVKDIDRAGGVPSTKVAYHHHRKVPLYVQFAIVFAPLAVLLIIVANTRD